LFYENRNEKGKERESERQKEDMDPIESRRVMGEQSRQKRSDKAFERFQQLVSLRGRFQDPIDQVRQTT